MFADTQLPTQRKTVIAGHHDVQHHQVDMLFIQHGAHLLAVGRAGGAITGLNEIVDNQFTNIPVVIDDKDMVNMLHRNLQTEG